MAKNTTIKRILKEASELTTNPSPDFHAAPSDENLFEWHFTLRGPPSPSPFARGIYHGRIILPPAYPLRPPSFRFLTPSGRFEPNREICLSISGHHEETWQPAWGVRTALVALRAFMDTDAAGQVGGMSSAEGVRRDLAERSRGWACATCARTSLSILEEQEEKCRELGVGEEKEESELVGKIGLVEPKKEGAEGQSTAGESTPVAPPSDAASATPVSAPTPPTPAPASQPAPSSQQQPVPPPQQQPTPTPARPLAVPQAPQRQPPPTTDAWIDKAIIGIVIALVFLILRRYA